MEVLIVGAGPTGLVCALVLAANGVPCRVLDRRREAPTTSRALGCQARSMELLASLGLAESVLKVSQPLTGSSIMKGEKEIGRQRWLPPDSPFPHTYVFPQAGLEAILRERLGEVGVEVEWSSEVLTLEQTPLNVRVTLADGRTLEAPWVVGCDGAHSRVREAAGIAFEGDATGEAYYLADVSTRPERPVEQAALWLGRDGPFMLMQLPGREPLWRIFADVSDQAGVQDLPEPTVETLQGLLDRRAFGKGRLTIERLHWTSVYRPKVCLASSYRRGRLFIAGDAAHVFPPFGGQGMNTGIQDAFNLAWKLARVVRGESPEALLDTYDAERRPVGAATIREVEGRRRLFALRNPVALAVRDLALRLMTKSERALRAASYANSQLGVSYRGRSWLSAGHGARPGAGDRAPDGPLTTGRVHTLFGPAHFTLLVFAPPDAPLQRPADLPSEVATAIINESTDPRSAVTATYRMRRGGFVLVRPDGYIGFRGDARSEAALRAYVAKIVSAPARTSAAA